MAGPDRPRWVNRIFSRKLAPAQDTTASTATPASRVPSPSVCGVAVSGTNPGNGSTMRRPKRRATSWEKPVAPIFGIDRPPVASTSAGAVKAP